MKKNSLTKLLALTLCAVLALSLFAGCAAKTEIEENPLVSIIALHVYTASLLAARLNL